MNPDGSVSEETKAKQRANASTQKRDQFGHFIKEGSENSTPTTPPTPVLNYKNTANSVDPLVNFQVNNPIPPFKRLLKRIFSNEEIVIKIPVLTAIAIVAFGLGGASGFLTAIKVQIASRVPIVNTIFPTPMPTEEPDPWVHDTLFGTLTKQTRGNYFLVTASGEVISIQAPENVNLEKLVGKKILAAGEYNKQEKLMNVSEADDLLQFSSTAPVPTIIPTSESDATNIPTATPSNYPEQTPEAMN